MNEDIQRDNFADLTYIDVVESKSPMLLSLVEHSPPDPIPRAG
jgi:hypothetical protein